MVGHLTSPSYLLFSEEDDTSLSHPHNQPLHIEVMIHQKRIRRVLIDNGAGLNIVSTTFLRQLDYDAKSIDPRRRITIKVYDEVERNSLGLVVFALCIGPVEQNVTC